MARAEQEEWEITCEIKKAVFLVGGLTNAQDDN